MTDAREELARILHADDVEHGKAFSEFEDMNADARAWYYDNADALMPLVAQIRAEAWDEGFDAGERDVWEHEADNGEGSDGWDKPCIKNPYRLEQS